MIPLKDNIPSRTTPVVNYVLIVICGLVFFAQLSTQSEQRAPLIEKFGMIPRRVMQPGEPVSIQERVTYVDQFGQLFVEEQTRQIAEPPFSPWWTLITCIFLHGGWMHMLGNTWFLFIFGDNVEDRMGHIPYLLFYLFCGIGASLAHLASDSSSTVPTIGASGAIAGVMGAYFLLYPRANVLAVLPIFFFIQVLVLPAPVFLGIWFAMQFFQGTLAITSMQTGGVAWWAHIGGFVVGYLVAAALRLVGETSPPVDSRRPHTDHINFHRYHR